MIAMICLYLCRWGQELVLTEAVMERENLRWQQIDTSPDRNSLCLEKIMDIKIFMHEIEYLWHICYLLKIH